MNRFEEKKQLFLTMYGEPNSLKPLIQCFFDCELMQMDHTPPTGFTQQAKTKNTLTRHAEKFAQHTTSHE